MILQSASDGEHFPCISESDPAEAEFQDFEPGQSTMYDEPVNRESDGVFIGFVHLKVTKSGQTNDVVCHVTFNFDSGDTLSALGRLPKHASQVVDSGRLAIAGGTGEYASVKGEVVVEVSNPKRWVIVIFPG